MTAYNSRNASNSRNESNSKTAIRVGTTTTAGMLAKVRKLEEVMATILKRRRNGASILTSFSIS
jgi:hypothetical protein